MGSYNRGYLEEGVFFLKKGKIWCFQNYLGKRSGFFCHFVWWPRFYKLFFLNMHK